MRALNFLPFFVGAPHPRIQKSMKYSSSASIFSALLELAWVMDRDLSLICDAYRLIGSDCGPESLIPRRPRPAPGPSIRFWESVVVSGPSAVSLSVV